MASPAARLSALPRNRRIIFAVAGALGALALAAPASALAAPATAKPKVIATIPVGSNPIGVAVSPRTGNVYVADSYVPGKNAGNVSVINGTTNKLIRTFPTVHGVFAVAASPRTGSIYVTSEGGKVLVISGKTSKVTRTVTVPLLAGGTVAGVAVSPLTGNVYIAVQGAAGGQRIERHRGIVAVVRGKTGKVPATLPVGYNPVAVAVSPEMSTSLTASAAP